MRNYLENFFNYLSGDTMWCDEESGHVESPTGHFALVEIPHNEDDRDYMFREIDALTGHHFGDNESDERPDSGWYVVITDSSGFVHWQNYSTEDAACNAFDALEAEYAEWDN